jgi:hypothetical protein
MLLAIVIAAAVLLVAWNFQRLHHFGTDYNFSGSFQGSRYECRLGGLAGEQGALCMIGADELGLYLLPHPNPTRWFWIRRGKYDIFKQSLFIPWKDIGCRSGRVLLSDCIWFDLASRKIYLYVPKDIGEKLLMDAGRTIPA